MKYFILFSYPNSRFEIHRVNFPNFKDVRYQYVSEWVQERNGKDFMPVFDSEKYATIYAKSYIERLTFELIEAGNVIGFNDDDLKPIGFSIEAFLR